MHSESQRRLGMRGRRCQNPARVLAHMLMKAEMPLGLPLLVRIMRTRMPAGFAHLPDGAPQTCPPIPTMPDADGINADIAAEADNLGSCLLGERAVDAVLAAQLCQAGESVLDRMEASLKPTCWGLQN